MATNYLKSQFAMPHHTVPTIGDTRVAPPTRRRLSLDRAQDRWASLAQTGGDNWN